MAIRFPLCVYFYLFISTVTLIYSSPLALNWPPFKSVTMPSTQTVIAWSKLYRKE